MRVLLWCAVLCGACSEDRSRECPVGRDATASCEEVCARLDDIDCVVGEEDECLEICASTTAGLDEVVRGRVLACMVAASSCREVDGCGRACGPDDGPVQFGADAGTGQDAGTDAAAPDGGEL